MGATSIEEREDNKVTNLEAQKAIFSKAKETQKATGVVGHGLGRSRFTSGKFSVDKIDKQLGENSVNVQFEQDQLQPQMADAQGEISTAFNAVVGGARMGAATIVEDLSYIPQVFKQLGGQDWEKNAVAEWAQETKANIQEGMPIYTADENGMSFWEGVRGVIDSSIGFGVPGGLIAKGVSTLGKTAKGMRIAAKLYKVNKKAGKLAMGLANSATFTERAGAIASGLIMNDLEGSMMGSELYETLVADGHTKEDASNAAHTFKNANRIFAISDAIQIRGIFGGVSGATRNKMSRKGLGEMAKSFGKVSLKNPLASGIGEAIEEVGQGVLSSEIEHRTNVDAGRAVDEDLSDYTVGRALDYVMTKEALFEGAMGFFGGGPQSLMSHVMAGEFNKKNVDDHNSRVDAQEQFVEDQKATIKNFLHTEKKLSALQRKALDSGTPEDIKIFNDAKYNNSLVNSFENGTADQLEAMLDDIAEMSPQEADEAGFAEDYKEAAQDRKAELLAKEKSFLQYYNHPNRKGVLANRFNAELIDKTIAANKEKKDNFASKVQEEINDISEEFGELTLVGEDGIIRPGMPSYELGGENSMGNISPENKERYKAFKNKVESLGSFQQWKKAKENEDNMNSHKKAVRDEFDMFMTPAYQDKTRARQKTFENYGTKIDNSTDASALASIATDVINDKSLDSEDQAMIDEAIKNRQSAIAKSNKNKTETANKRKTIKDKKAKAKLEKEEKAKADKEFKAANKVTTKETKETKVAPEVTDKTTQTKPTGPAPTGPAVTPTDVSTDTKVETTVETKVEPVTTLEEDQFEASHDNADNKKNDADENVSYDNKSSEKIKNSEDKVEDELQADGSRKIANPDGTTSFYIGNKTENSFNVFAYLSRQYKRIFTGDVTYIKETEDNLNSDEGFFNKDILDPRQFKVGTKLSIEVDNDYTGKIKHPDTGELVDWVAFKDEATAQEITDNVPIKIVDSKSGETLAYIHSTAWANEENIYGNVVANKAKTTALRVAVQEGPFSTTITHKSAGKLFRTKNRDINVLSEMMPDTDLDLHVAIATDELVNDKGEAPTEVVNSVLIPGVTYVVVDTQNGGKMALPVYNTKVGENADIKQSIILAVKLFMTDESRWNQEEKDFHTKMLKGSPSIDLSNSADARDYITQFIHSTILDGQTMKDYSQSKDSSKVFFNISNSVSWSHGKGVSTVTSGSTVSTKFDELTDAEIESLLYSDKPNSLSRLLDEMYLQPNKKNLQDKNTILTANNDTSFKNYKEMVKATSKSDIKSANIGTEAEPNWVYTLQPVIEFDTSSLTDDSKLTAKAKEETKVTAVEEATKVNKTEEELADEEKGNSPLDFDLSDLFGDRDLTPVTVDPALAAEVNRGAEARKKEEFKEGTSTENVSDDNPAAISTKVKQEIAKDSEGLIVEGFTSSKQDKVTATIMNKAVEVIIASKDKKSLKAIYKKIKVEFKSLQEVPSTVVTTTQEAIVKAEEIVAIAQEAIPKNTGKVKAQLEALLAAQLDAIEVNTALLKEASKSVDNFQQVLDNFTQLANLTTKKLESIGLVDVNSKGETVTTELEKTQFTVDDVTRDSRETVSAQVKRALSGVTKRDVNGDPVYNYLGQEEKVPFEEVYSALQSILVGTDADFNTKIALLTRTRGADGKFPYPWMADVISKLVYDSTPQLQTLFTIATTQHYVNMEFVVWDIDKNGNFVVRKWNSDSASKTRTLLTNWKTKATLGKLYKFNDKEGEYLVNQEEVTRLKAIFDAGPTNMTEEILTDFFKSIGVELKASTAKDIISGQFRHNRKSLSLNQQFTNANGIFNIINKGLLSKTTHQALASSNILDDTIFKTLAKHDSNYRSNVYATSFRDGGKSISSNANNKFIVERTKKLKDDKKFVEKILNTSYGKNSELLSSLVDYKIREDGTIEVIDFKDNEMYAKFNYAYAGFNPYKKMKSTEMGDVSLQSKAVSEHEAYKLNTFLASIAADKSKTAQFIIPTSSDKSTSIKLVLPYQKASYEFSEESPNTKLSASTKERLFESLFMSEYDRILAFQAKGSKSSVKGFEDGAGTFLVLPELNTLPGLFDENGDITPNLGNMRPAIDALIQDYVNSMVEEKLAEWTNFDIGTPIIKKDKNDKDVVRKDGSKVVLRHNHVDSKALNKAKSLDNLALDMVTNYLVANSEYFKVIVGDPAQFFKGKAVDKTLSIEEQTKAHIANAKSTFDNITKRLAGDIAPGINAANTANKTIKYLMLKDRASSSTSLAYYKELGLNNLSDYETVEGTDAQEWTTIEEHLDVMLMFGKISEEEHAMFLEQSKKETLDFKDEFTKAIFQPIKPVYVNSYVDTKNDLLRRLYVKSSSFPLIPQLTKGLEIDKVRVMMEDRGINRAAFGSGVKVGNTATQTDVFNSTKGKQGTTVKDFISKADQDRKEQLIDKKDSKGITKKEQAELTELNKFAEFDEATTLTVSREGFKIQQEIPFKSKEEINKVTQASKLIFVNMLNEEFSVAKLPTSVQNRLTPTDGVVTGKELQTAYYDLYKELYLTGQNELSETILEDNQLNKGKLSALLLKEAQSRNYPLSVQQAIKSDPEFKYLPYSIYSEKFESLLNSIVSNAVIKQQLPGRSFILGSEEGMTLIEGKEGQELIDNTDGIIYTDAWTGSLNAASRDKGEMKPSQVFVSSKFTMNDGSTLNLREVNKDGSYVWLKTTFKDGVATLTIDNDKVDPEVLRAFGMRIPNQGPNSTANIEIAGFLPDSMADLIIASRDFTVQMGSDFDIDKLYSYNKFNFINSEGKLVALTSENKDDLIQQKQDELVADFNDKSEGAVERFTEKISIAKDNNEMSEANFQMLIDLKSKSFEEKSQKIAEETSERINKALDRLAKSIDKKVLKNDIVDIHLAVASNPSNGIQAQMAEPLAFGPMKQDAVKIDTWRSNKVSGSKFSGFSDKFQRDKYISGNSGKIGTALFSLDSVSNALMQGKDLRFVEKAGTMESAPEYFKMSIGNTVSDGYLSDEKTLDGSDTKSNVISWYQSAAVDNANENLMGRLNINKDTMNTVRAMNQLGFKNETPLLITQDIIFDYIETLNGLNSALSTFKGDSAVEALRLMEEKYPNSGLPVTGSNLTVDKMESMIKNGSKEVSYNSLQRVALASFLTLADKGKTLASVSSTLNVDTAGLGKSIIHSMEKENQVRSFNTIEITNISSMIGEEIDGEVVPTTINGFAIEYGLKFNNALWSELFPYKSATISEVFKEIEEIKGTNFTVDSRTDLYTNIWRDMKSYLFANSKNGLTDGDMFNERKRLLIDTPTNKSLATIVHELEAHPLLADNSFFQKLTAKPEKGGKPSTIGINASSREALDEEHIYLDLLEMLQSNNETVIMTANGIDYTVGLLAQDLVTYQMLNGAQQGPTDFTKYISNSYLKAGTNLVDNMTNLDFAGDSVLGLQRGNASTDQTNYHMVSDFTTQFFQHNPYAATESKDDISFKGTDVMVKPTFYREGTGDDIKLFKWNGATYERLPLLGEPNLFEYSSETSVQYSTNKNNNPNNKVHSGDVLNRKQNAINSKITNPYKKSKSSFTFKSLEKEGLTGKEQIEGILEEIALHPDFVDTQFGIYSELLLMNKDKLIKSIKFVEGTASDYNVATETLSIGTDMLESGSTQEEAFLHELTHAFTSKFANAYQNDILPKNTQEYKILNSLDNNRKSLIKKLENDKNGDFAKQGLVFDGEETVIIDGKSVTRKTGFKELVKQYEAFKLFKARKANGETKKDESAPTVDKDLIDKYYGFYNLNEFITNSSTNKEFQDVLNNIPRMDNKSWVTLLLEKYKELVGRLLGVKSLKKDSELYETLSKVYEFVQADRTNEAVDYADIETKIRVMLNDGTIKKDCK
tara:strand:- start:381 stop:11963 length:11583 start_codon:yes stop_codon:yes gene_type:complete